MKVEMVMPQMGESITEGTIIRWTKKVGERVARDENVLEISTDKVDSEIPSPAAGLIVELKAKEGETVPVGQVIAVLETEAGVAVPAAAVPVSPVPAAQVAPAAPASASLAGGPYGALTDNTGPAAASVAPPPAPPAHPVAPPTPAVTPPPAAPRPAPPGPAVPAASGDRFYSPLVRSIARAEGIGEAELATVAGSGRGGRVTRDDLLAHVKLREQGGGTVGIAAVSGVGGGLAIGGGPLAGAAFQAGPGAGGSSVVGGIARGGEYRPYPKYTAAEVRQSQEGPIEVVPMDVMRQKIAEHMVRSKATSPHVASVTEVDMTRVVRLRDASKGAFEAANGFKLTYTPFIVAAAARALVEYPMMNASVEGTQILVKRFVNIGVAVALENGLIVPVVKHAEEKNFLGIARAIQDLAARARSKKLLPEDVQGGTFAVTNMGGFGNLFGIPIINQPNVGILGAGAIVKRPVVVDDAIAIRDIMYLSLSYDHRVVDGALGGMFIQRVRHHLEQTDPAAWF